MKQLWMHLTNNCISKKHPDFNIDDEWQSYMSARILAPRFSEVNSFVPKGTFFFASILRVEHISAGALKASR